MPTSTQEQRDAAHQTYLEKRAERESAKSRAQESLRSHQRVVHERDDAIRACENAWLDYRVLGKQLTDENASTGPAARRRVAQTSDPQVAAEQVRRGLTSIDALPEDLRGEVREMLGQTTIEDVLEAPDNAQPEPDNGSETDQDRFSFDESDPTFIPGYSPSV